MVTCKICREPFDSIGDLIEHVEGDEFHSNATYPTMTFGEFKDIFVHGRGRGL